MSRCPRSCLLPSGRRQGVLRVRVGAHARVPPSAALCRPRPQAVRELAARASARLGLRLYPYSPFHIFFEQYLTIGGEALTLLSSGAPRGGAPRRARAPGRRALRCCEEREAAPCLRPQAPPPPRPAPPPAAGAAIWLVCLGATGSPWSATLVVGLLAALLVDLMGFMALAGIQLNAGAGRGCGARLAARLAAWLAAWVAAWLAAWVGGEER